MSLSIEQLELSKETLLTTLKGWQGHDNCETKNRIIDEIQKELILIEQTIKDLKNDNDN